jgi:hypothetical protein
MSDAGNPGGNTVAKRFAFSTVIQNAAIKRLAFGIAAPGTLQGASLIKDHGSDPVSVMRGKPLDIENHDNKSTKMVILNIRLKCKSFHNKYKKIINESEINFE